MGDMSTDQDAKGAGQGVINQTQKSSNELYKYVDLNGGGCLVEAFRRAQARKDFTEVEELIEAFREKFLYNNGAGKDVDIEELVQWRLKSRKVQKPSKRESSLKACFTKCSSRVEDTIEAVGTDHYAMKTENIGTYGSCIISFINHVLLSLRYSSAEIVFKLYGHQFVHIKVFLSNTDLMFFSYKALR